MKSEDPDGRELDTGKLKRLEEKRARKDKGDSLKLESGQKFQENLERRPPEI